MMGGMRRGQQGTGLAQKEGMQKIIFHQWKTLHPFWKLKIQHFFIFLNIPKLKDFSLLAHFPSMWHCNQQIALAQQMWVRWSWSCSIRSRSKHASHHVGHAQPSSPRPRALLHICPAQLPALTPGSCPFTETAQSNSAPQKTRLLKWAADKLTFPLWKIIFPTGIFSLAWFTRELCKSVGQHRQCQPLQPLTGDESQVPQCGSTEKQGKMLSLKSHTGPNRHSSHISCFTILNCTLHSAFSLPPQITGIT